MIADYDDVGTIQEVLQAWLDKHDLAHDCVFWNREEWIARDEDFGKCAHLVLCCGQQLEIVLNGYSEGWVDLVDELDDLLEDAGWSRELAYCYLYFFPTDCNGYPVKA